VNSLTTSAISLVLMFGATLLGIRIRSRLPAHHLNEDSRDVVKLSTAQVGTMAALVLGLLVASAKGFYDSQATELIQISANMILLDRTLAQYGPEASKARNAVRDELERMIEQMSSTNGSKSSRLEPNVAGGRIYDEIEALAPKNDLQGSLRSQALNMTISVGQARWLMFEQESQTVSMPLLVMLVFWLVVTFLVTGLLAAPNGTVIMTVFVSALAASGAILLILAMYSPFEGLIRIPDTALRAALSQVAH
jgi:hypothetical protein